jgi:aspartate-semialdehyde dehydrogenase
LAVVGATGAVGTVLLDLVNTRPDVWGEVIPVASARSAGKTVRVRGEDVTVKLLEPSVFEGVDIAVFDVPDEVSAEWAPVAASYGAVAVDNSGAFRMDADVPLVVPEVNPLDAKARPRGIIANPNCTTLSMVVALGVLHKAFGLTSMFAASYQAASGAGQIGIDRLQAEISAVAGKGLGSVAGDVRGVAPEGESPFPAPLALNVVPVAGSWNADGWTSEELKIRNESRKILGIPGLAVSATCVRVPVVTTHSVAVHATFAREVGYAEAVGVLSGAPGLELRDVVTPADVVGTDPTYVARLRQAIDDPFSLDFFVCGDNLRKGAALNTIQIAELVAAEKP